MSRGAYGGASEQGGEGHTHGVSADPDRFWLGAALALLLAFMAVEVVVGLLSGSLALLSDAAHMLTDAGAIALALVAIRLAARPARGGYTYGLKRAEILSAQANGITLLLLPVYFGYEGVRRLVDPPPVEGMAVPGHRAGRDRGEPGRHPDDRQGQPQQPQRRGRLPAHPHRSVRLHRHRDRRARDGADRARPGRRAGRSGHRRIDGQGGYGLVRESGRVFLEAAPRGVDPQRVEADICATTGVMGVHELHIWEVTSGFPALSAHVLVGTAHDCHERRVAIERSLADRYDIHHTTLQVDHRDEPDGRPGACAGGNGGCGDPPAAASGTSS